MKVQFTPVVDYAATVEGLSARKLDLVWYGGFTSVQAVRRTNGTAKRLTLREEDAQFKSVFIASPGSGIKTLADLKGKTFAFGSVGSTSGHLMPRSFILKTGLQPEKDFKQVAYSGAHDATALWVESGKVEAGALNFLVWDKLVQTKKVDLAKVNVFYTTPPYVDYVWTARGDLDQGVQERITAAFLKLDYNNPEHRKLLDLHRTKKYIKANDADWKGIEEAAIGAGLLK
jgi:phosphonate transport system substrate-binding protein